MRVVAHHGAHAHALPGGELQGLAALAAGRAGAGPVRVPSVWTYKRHNLRKPEILCFGTLFLNYLNHSIS